MALTDLTNTTWVFNETVDFSAMGFPASGYVSNSYTINFVSNATNYTKMSVSQYSATSRNISYGYTSAYSSYNNKWTKAEYRTIEITGGTHANNATLIAWLQSTATRVFPSYRVSEQDMVSVADAIRQKGGTSAPLQFPGGFVDAINAL